MSEQTGQKSLAQALEAWANLLIVEANLSHNTGTIDPSLKGAQYALRTVGVSLIDVLTSEGLFEPSKPLSPTKDIRTPQSPARFSEASGEPMVATIGVRVREMAEQGEISGQVAFYLYHGYWADGRGKV